MKELKDNVIKLRNGVEMPLVGFGTFKIPEGEEVIEAVKFALKAGYRHIDTATAYKNEKGVGTAIKESGIPREEIFLVSKLWNRNQGYQSTLDGFEKTLKELDTDYLDLYLIHWPKELSKESWKAMEELYKAGKIRAIGVCNFMVHHLKDLMEECEIVPMVNQVELHPQFPETPVRKYCKEHGIAIEAWGPLMQGKIFGIDLMKEIAQKHNKTIAQVAIRWHYQQDIISIPKSSKEERIVSNVQIFDFELDNEDMEKIATLNTGIRIGKDPDHITF